VLANDEFLMSQELKKIKRSAVSFEHAGQAQDPLLHPGTEHLPHLKFKRRLCHRGGV